jgi:heat shock protein beta
MILWSNVEYLFMSHEQVVDGEAKFRWYSVLTTGREIPNKTKQLNLKHTFFLGTRYESTAAESDSSSSPPSVGEKYEYQAEVHQWRFWGISFLYSRNGSWIWFYWCVSLFNTWWQVSRLMDLIVNSLYSNKEVFLRELIRHVIFSFLLFFLILWCTVTYLYLPGKQERA